jgi:hypothetical protein
VSTGKPGHSTPPGVFSILQRNRFHRSNLYSNAPMPYMQRLTWSGIALHEGHLPGYPASHGCIRMPGNVSRQLWAMGSIGMRVIVSPGRTSPRAIEHASLPSPATYAQSETAGVIRVASTADVAAATPTLSPYAAAQARVTAAVEAKVIADRAVKPALDRAADRAAAARRLSEALRASAGILADAEEHLELERLAMSTVQTESAEAVMADRIRSAEAGARAAKEAHEALAAEERSVSDAAFAAARDAREASKEAERATRELSLARKGTSPLHIFVSRKTGQVYLRQGYQDLHQEPAVIGDPDRPLGTHVYTAMETSGDSVRWMAVSVHTPKSAPTGRRRGTEAAADDRPASSAEEALSRLQLSAEVRTLLSERLWPGASLTISDYGLGETGEGTDFVIITR